MTGAYNLQEMRDVRPRPLMIFEKMLLPELMLSRFCELTPELCEMHGIRGLICDIDNTLATYDDITMPEATEDWANKMRDAGIRLAFVSNNTEERVRTFIGGRDICGFPNAHKPSIRYFEDAAETIGCADGGAAVLGDQLLTDCLAAHRAGLPAVIVPPIKDRTGAFFRFKRRLERPYVMKYLNKHPESGIADTVWHEK